MFIARFFLFVLTRAASRHTLDLGRGSYLWHLSYAPRDVNAVPPKMFASRFDIANHPSPQAFSKSLKIIMRYILPSLSHYIYLQLPELCRMAFKNVATLTEYGTTCYMRKPEHRFELYNGSKALCFQETNVSGPVISIDYCISGISSASFASAFPTSAALMSSPSSLW